MTSLNSSGSLGNVISRLQGLKNVSGRKVMPGAEFLQNLEEVDTDVSGTAPALPNFANFAPPSQNLPESDLGGELTPQSYDVRANVVNSPETEQEESGFFSKLGKSLADYVNPQKRDEMSKYNQSLMDKARGTNIQSPPIETAQVDMQEGLPPVTASEQSYQSPKAPEGSGGIWGSIADYFSPTKRDEMSQYNNELLTDAQLLSQGKNPSVVRSEKNEGFNQEVQKAMEQPWQYSAYGSANEVANSPVLQAKFKEVTGIDYEPQIAEQVSAHEAAMKGVEDSLNGIQTSLGEREEAIKQRILNNQSTDADKIYIGLALLMPLLVGGLFGKEAALGALSGGAKGFADVLGRRQKDTREDEASLLDIAKQKAGNEEKMANINLEKAKLGPSIRKNLPEQPNQHLMGMKEIEWQDPASGEVRKAYRVKPGLVAQGEYMTSEEGKKDMLKAANELSSVKSYVDDINSLTNDVVNIASQLKDPSVFNKMFVSILSKKDPGTIPKVTQDIMFNGRKVNAGAMLEEKLGFLANKYGMAQQLGQLDRAAQSHIQKIMANPTTTLLTPQDSINQMVELRNLAQQGLVREATNKGFVPEFLIDDMEKENNSFYGSLNQRDQDKRTADIKQKINKNETNYAK